MKNILLATRPLTPPWDEASKNFAYFLAKSIHDPKLLIHILTTKQRHLPPAFAKAGAGRRLSSHREFLDTLTDNVIPHAIYPPNDENHAGFPFSQKVRIPLYLMAHAHEYDVIHYLFTPTKFNSCIIKNFTSRKPKTIQTIATLREDLYSPSDWKQMFFADRLVTYSDYSKRKLEAAGFDNVERIYPGIDLERYSSQPKDPEAMRALDIMPEDFVILHNGEYARLGATDMLVEMLVQHLNSSPNSDEEGVEARGPLPYEPQPKHGRTIFIFGNRLKNDMDKQKKAEVVERLTAAGVIGQVRFTDTWKDMPTLYNLADVVVFPAANMKGKFDIPLVIIETQACAKPIILSDLPIFAEFSNPDISVTVPRGDSEALWQAIEDVRNDRTKSKALGMNARTFVEKNFDLKNTSRQYEFLYHQGPSLS